MGIAFAGASAIPSIIAKAQQENIVYIPAINSGAQNDYVKLAEYVVPSFGFAEGFRFVEIGEYRKYILSISANITSEMSWFPSIRINEAESGYTQYTSIMFDDGKSHFEKANEETAIVLPITVFTEKEQANEIFPYTASIEITNVPGMYKFISGNGGYPVYVLGFASFSITGMYQSSDPVSQIDLFGNFPTGLFGQGTTISLYGVR